MVYITKYIVILCGEIYNVVLFTLNHFNAFLQRRLLNENLLYKNEFCVNIKAVVQ
jgi:hypothetical protein